MRTVLITNGNLLSLLSLGDFLCRFHPQLAAVFRTTRLPSQRNNLTGILSMFRASGYAYTHFKLLTNVLLPRRLRARGLPTTVEEFLRHLGSTVPVIEAPAINDPAMIRQVRDFHPEVILSMSATTRFGDELVDTASRAAVNAHYALLPAYAGLSPYFWYLRHQERQCGVTLHQIVSKLDAGPIIEQQRFAMDGLNTVFAVLREQTARVSPMLIRYYQGETSESHATVQDLSRRSYFRHPTREDVAALRRHGHRFWDQADLDAVAEQLERLARHRSASAGMTGVRGTADARPGPAPAGKRTPREEEAEQVRRSWYVAPKPPAPMGWLVFSEEFVLRVLQGRFLEQSPARRTGLWRVLALLLRSTMAVAQFGLMFLSLMPLIGSIMEMLAVHFKRGALGFFLRSCYWKTRLRALGQDTLIERGFEVWGAGNIEIGSCCHLDTLVRLAAGEGRYGQGGRIAIGDYCHIGPRCHAAGRGGVRIGDLVALEAGVHIYSATQTLIHAEDPGRLVSFSHVSPHDFQRVIEAPVFVGDYAMIGFGSVVMPGASIELGAIVHPHTQVIGQYPAFANITGPGRSRQNGWRRPPRKSPHLKE